MKNSMKLKWGLKEVEFKVFENSNGNWRAYIPGMEIHVSRSYGSNWWVGSQLDDIIITKGTPQEALTALYEWVKHQAEECRRAVEHGNES